MFVLCGHFLYYFRKQNEQYRGVICLYNCGVSTLDSFEGKEGVFMITPRTTRKPQWRQDNTRRFYLCADSNSEVDSWAKFLKVAGKTKSFHKGEWGGRIDPNEGFTFVQSRMKDEDETPEEFWTLTTELDGEVERERKELIEKMIQLKKKAKERPHDSVAAAAAEKALAGMKPPIFFGTSRSAEVPGTGAGDTKPDGRDGEKN